MKINLIYLFLVLQALDSLETTHPVEVPVGHPDEVNEVCIFFFTRLLSWWRLALWMYVSSRR